MSETNPPTLTLCQVHSSEHVAAAEELMREYTEWVMPLAPDSEQAPAYTDLERELASLPGPYAPPNGSLQLAMVGDRAAGCVALKRLDTTTAELKRMYVRSEFRGRSLGTHLVTALIRDARQLGYQRIVLDSLKVMTHAHQVYQSLGFRLTQAPVDFPEQLRSLVVFMALELGPIIDLRDYTLAPGTCDRLIARCEAEFFPEQERLGARFVGWFRDADDPDRFVWLRGMSDLSTRVRVLTEFYRCGDMWQQNKADVNPWIVDSDNVLLLRLLMPLAAPAAGDSIVGMYTHLAFEPIAPRLAAQLAQQVPAAIAAAGGRLLASLATDPSDNNFPPHPIRTGEHGFIWLASFEPQQYRALGLDSVQTRRLIPSVGSPLR